MAVVAMVRPPVRKVFLCYVLSTTNLPRPPYIGYTGDIWRRFREHTSGNGSKQTKEWVKEGGKLKLVAVVGPFNEVCSLPGHDPSKAATSFETSWHTKTNHDSAHQDPSLRTEQRAQEKLLNDVQQVFELLNELLNETPSRNHPISVCFQEQHEYDLTKGELTKGVRLQQLAKIMCMPVDQFLVHCMRSWGGWATDTCMSTIRSHVTSAHVVFGTLWGSGQSISIDIDIDSTEANAASTDESDESDEPVEGRDESCYSGGVLWPHRAADPDECDNAGAHTRPVSSGVRGSGYVLAASEGNALCSELGVDSKLPAVNLLAGGEVHALRAAGAPAGVSNSLNSSFSPERGVKGEFPKAQSTSKYSPTHVGGQALAEVLVPRQKNMAVVIDNGAERCSSAPAGGGVLSDVDSSVAYTSRSPPQEGGFGEASLEAEEPLLEVAEQASGSMTAVRFLKKVAGMLRGAGGQ